MDRRIADARDNQLLLGALLKNWVTTCNRCRTLWNRCRRISCYWGRALWKRWQRVVHDRIRHQRPRPKLERKRHRNVVHRRSINALE